jgi:hypothetical protein
MSATSPSSLWTLPNGVHAAALEDDLVFLHVARDAYFCLPGGALALRLRRDGRTAEAADPALAASLVEAGLLQPPGTDGGAPPRPLPAPPAASAIRDRLPAPRWRDLPEVAWSLVDVLRHYRGRTLAEILRRARRPVAVRRGARSEDLRDIVDRFHRWVPYAPVSGKCLLRSFMLLRLLRRRGHDAVWVFGVTTWPFAAHCWLQVGDVVLDDAFERLLPFRPILAV